mgnify:CR=1 FL=1
MDALGLGDLGRKESYLARQLKRWTTQWEATKIDPIPAMEESCRILTETILLIEGELQYRIENQEALLIEEATRQVKESMDHEQDQSRTIDSNASFNEELAISDLKDFQDSKTEYREVKDKLKLIREEIDSES